jgi:hypothetical protein
MKRFWDPHASTQSASTISASGKNGLMRRLMRALLDPRNLERVEMDGDLRSLPLPAQLEQSRAWRTTSPTTTL